MADCPRSTTSRRTRPPWRGNVLRAYSGIRAAALLGFLCTLCSPAVADKIVHNDGTTVEGKISQETRDEIHIETRFGPLRFLKTDIAKIERDAVARATPLATPAGPVLDYSTVIPRVPVNPESPPQLPDITEMARRGIPPPPKQDPATTPAGAATTAPASAESSHAGKSDSVASFERVPAAGTVTVSRGGATIAATAQTSLAPETRVATANSGASILLADGTRAKLPPDSVVEIPAPGSPMRLISGSVWVATSQSAPRQLEIQAADSIGSADPKSANTQTVFRVSLDASGRVRLSCLAGTATLRWAKGDTAMTVPVGSAVELDTKNGTFRNQPGNESMLQIEWKSL